jgi:hypothetical protein
MRLAKNPFPPTGKPGKAKFDVRGWAKYKCPVLPLDLTVYVRWFQCNAALKGSPEPALGVSPFS